MVLLTQTPALDLIQSYGILVLIIILIIERIFSFAMLSGSQTKMNRILETVQKNSEEQAGQQHLVNEAFQKTISELQSMFQQWLTLVKKESQFLRTNCLQHSSVIEELKTGNMENKADISKVNGRVDSVNERVEILAQKIERS